MLEDLLKSEGWRLFTERVLDEWQGQGFFARIGPALAGNDPLLPKVLYRAALEIERAFKWPEARVKHLKGHTE